MQMKNAINLKENCIANQYREKISGGKISKIIFLNDGENVFPVQIKFFKEKLIKQH